MSRRDQLSPEDRAFYRRETIAGVLAIGLVLVAFIVPPFIAYAIAPGFFGLVGSIAVGIACGVAALIKVTEGPRR